MTQQENSAVGEGAAISQTPAAPPTVTAYYADGTTVTGPEPAPSTSPSGAPRVTGPETHQAVPSTADDHPVGTVVPATKSISTGDSGATAGQRSA